MSVFIADDSWDGNGEWMMCWSEAETYEPVMIEYQDGTHMISMFVEV